MLDRSYLTNVGELERFENIYAGDRYVVYRARDESGRAVVVKTLAMGSDDVVSAGRLRHEYELLASLDVQGAAQAIGWQEVDGAPALVLEPAGTMDLGDRLRRGTLKLSEFLDLALQMAEVVGHLHEHAIVHRDISPTKFVLDEKGRITLVGFGLATSLSGHTPLGELEGTLAYMAPEQTGRMRRAVDHRADLYALGATFYAMLVGSPPFPSLDPAEVVHAHLAVRPVSPSVTNAAVPSPISDIVLKLLAKNPEERYQSAEGLAVDLLEARRQWLEGGTIQPFLLGREDLARELPIPERLFGREREWDELAAALRAAVSGEQRFVLVSGRAGIGKSALIERLAQSVPPSGRFAAGKCDQLRGNVPLAPFLQAFGRIVSDLLAQPPEARAAWRERMQRALEENGKLLTDLLPELEQLVGRQPNLEELEPAERENRLSSLLSAFIKALCQSGPLVLFVDDLQWADASTLKLLAELASSPPIDHLLLVAAHRSEELTPALAATLARVRESASAVTNLELGPLDLDAVTALLVETLRSTPEQAAPIARVVHEKTAGNPLFIRRLLRFLWQAELFSYDRRSDAYAWNRARIAEVPVTENVADLLVAGMQRLPPITRNLLQVAACIGTRFDLCELASTTGYGYEEAGHALWSALQEGFLVPVEEGPRVTDPRHDAQLTTAVYRFAHDRVQEAAYALLDEDERQGWHLRIGRTLLGMDFQVVERRIFDVVHHLEQAAGCMSAPERLQLAELKLRAGRRAKVSAAYGSAFEYLTHGLGLLDSDAARTTYPLWFELHREAAECAYLIGQHSRCETLIAEALADVANDLDCSALMSIRVLAATARGAYAEGVRVSREALARFGIELPEHDLGAAVEREFAGVQSAIAGRSPRELLQLPLLTDAAKLACLRLLANAMAAAYYFDQRTFALFALRTLRFCLEHGASLYMPRAWADYALILSARRQYALAHEFGQLAIDLCARVGNRREESKVLFIVGMVKPWREPLRNSVQMLRTAYARGISTGEFQGAAIAAAIRVQNMYASGSRLDIVLGEIEACHIFIHQIVHKAAIDLVEPYRQAVRCLKGYTRSPQTFEDEQFDEARFMASAARVALSMYATLRLQAAYLMGDTTLASKMSRLAAEHVDASSGFIYPADHGLYTALTLAALRDRRSPTERAAPLARISDIKGELALWAENCPENFRHKLQLVSAEQARMEGQLLLAAGLYEEAISGAQREGFLQDEALANERYGRFCMAHGLSRSASEHLGAAIRGYANWGAVVKARALELEFAAYGISPAKGLKMKADVLRTRAAGPDALEVDRLLEAADTLAAELVLPRLLEKLLRLSLELVGAERAALVVTDGEVPVVRATGTALGISLEATALAESDELPRSIAEHVLRTSSLVVLSNAGREGGFGADPYVRGRGVKSVLAVPVRRAGRSSGVLYLENNLATDVFTPDRVQTLELLSGQIGSALDNALLVHQLEAEVAERKRKETEARFLSEVSAALAESLDYETTLVRAARLAVPGIADMCLVDIVEGKEIRPVATIHADAREEPLLQEFRARYPLRWDGPQPASHALRSGTSLLISEVTEEAVQQYVRDAEHGRLVRALRIGSVIATPLIAHGRTLGAITLLATERSRYRAPELALAEEFARRTAMAVDNARLYRTSEDAVRARDEFLSIASHELRTPVASLQLAIEGTTKGVIPETPEAKKRTNAMIERQVARLGKLIEQLLSVSRIQAGRLALQPEPVDMAVAVRNAVDHLTDTIARSGSPVAVDAKEPVVGRWNASALEQVATNLLTNAVKFGQKKPISVTVEKLGDTGRMVVRDQGIGISEERLPHIFERFERAVSAREYGGLGLGLFIARSIVDALGGTISVDSHPGAGAEFSVQLPCSGPAQGVAS